jgi:tripartite-type tricarboxylate transporter receptor subunit TctC
MAGMRFAISAVLSLVFFFGTVDVNSALAAGYPERKIRLIAAFAPGGGTDLGARTLARYANPFLEDRLYVENVVGAGGAIGFREGAKAPADGYTLTMITTSTVIGENFVKDWPKIEGFEPICILNTDPMTLTVKADSRFKTAADLASYAKAHPGELSISTAGHGSYSHLLAVAVQEMLGSKMNIVPFQGAQPALTAVAGGHVELGASGIHDALTLLEGKKIRSLMVFSDKRSSYLPDVPTTKEIGYSFVMDSFIGVGAPRGTPKQIIEYLGQSFKKAVENEECKKAFENVGLPISFIPPQEAGPWLKATRDLFGNLATKAGIKPE